MLQFLDHLLLDVATRLRRWTPLATRLLMGQAFLLTGLGKWRHLDGTAEFFASAGIPAPAANAVFIATVELLGGLCLLVGFGTRVAAALLASTMVVALATADRDTLLGALSFQGDRGLTDVTPLVFLLFLGWVFAMGAGPLSADEALRKRLVRDPALGR